LEARKEDLYFNNNFEKLNNHTLEEMLHQQKLNLLTADEVQHLHATKSDIQFYGFFALGAVNTILGMFISYKINSSHNVFLSAFLMLLSIALGYCLAFATFVAGQMLWDKYKDRLSTAYKPLYSANEAITVENYDYLEITRPTTDDVAIQEVAQKPELKVMSA
jgi:hypothetical protein